MNWQPTARKDFRDSIRSRTIWFLMIAFVGLFVLGTALVPSSSTSEFIDFVGVTLTNVVGFLPVIAIVLGYKSVIHERESGSLVLALSVPQSRLDFVVGTVVGRSLVLAVPVVAGLLLGGVIATVQYDGTSPGLYLVFVATTLLYGIAFVAVAIACSMSATTNRRALASAFGVYAVFDLFWTGLVNSIVAVLYRFEPVATPDWAVFLQLLVPGEAYVHVMSEGFGVDGTGTGAHLATETPWLVNSWTALVVLCVWIVVPLAVGYYRFRATDL